MHHLGVRGLEEILSFLFIAFHSCLSGTDKRTSKRKLFRVLNLW